MKYIDNDKVQVKLTGCIIQKMQNLKMIHKPKYKT